MNVEKKRKEIVKFVFDLIKNDTKEDKKELVSSCSEVCLWTRKADFEHLCVFKCILDGFIANEYSPVDACLKAFEIYSPQNSVTNISDDNITPEEIHAHYSWKEHMISEWNKMSKHFVESVEDTPKNERFSKFVKASKKISKNLNIIRMEIDKCTNNSSKISEIEDLLGKIGENIDLYRNKMYSILEEDCKKDIERIDKLMEKVQKQNAIEDGLIEALESIQRIEKEQKEHISKGESFMQQQRSRNSRSLFNSIQEGRTQYNLANLDTVLEKAVSRAIKSSGK